MGGETSTLKASYTTCSATATTKWAKTAWSTLHMRDTLLPKVRQWLIEHKMYDRYAALHAFIDWEYPVAANYELKYYTGEDTRMQRTRPFARQTYPLDDAFRPCYRQFSLREHLMAVDLNPNHKLVLDVRQGTEFNSFAQDVAAATIPLPVIACTTNEAATQTEDLEETVPDKTEEEPVATAS